MQNDFRSSCGPKFSEKGLHSRIVPVRRSANSRPASSECFGAFEAQQCSTGSFQKLRSISYGWIVKIARLQSIVIIFTNISGTNNVWECRWEPAKAWEPTNQGPLEKTKAPGSRSRLLEASQGPWEPTFCRKTLFYDIFCPFREPKFFISLRWKPKLHFIVA